MSGRQIGSDLVKSLTTGRLDSGADVPEPTSKSLSAFTNWILVAYLAIVLAVTLATRTSPSADVFIVFVALAAVLLGRGIAFLRDWIPFLVVFLAWEAMRGVANQFGQSVQSDSIIAVESALFGGVPTVQLQQALRTTGAVSVLDVAMTLVYVSHFFFPLALAFVLWWGDRPRYYRFVTTLMAVSFAAFITFMLMPVAPPRFAADYGAALPVTDVMSEVTRSIDWHGFSWMYGNLVGNPVAAFPSMHAAYPVLVFLFVQERSRLAALAWLPAIPLVWFATVYLGHHYVVDLLGGALYAFAGYWLLRDGRIIRSVGSAYRASFIRVRRDLRNALHIGPATR
jgi:membrane-associated phospholipid phosphatase